MLVRSTRDLFIKKIVFFRFFSDFGWGEGATDPGDDEWGFREPSSRRRIDGVSDSSTRRRADDSAVDDSAVTLAQPPRRQRLEDGQAQPRRIAGFGRSDSQLYNRYVIICSTYCIFNDRFLTIAFNNRTGHRTYRKEYKM
jgi:hypothetical protein